MTSLRKAVLKEIRAALPAYLPAFKPADFAADPYRKKDALFVAPGASRLYGLWIEFSSKKPGDFTGELLVMASPAMKELPLVGPADFTPEREGNYRIGFFICGFDRWWQLRDHESEAFEFSRSLNPDVSEETRMQPWPYNWRPADFSAPIETRTHDAVHDFLVAIRDSVVPKLSLLRGGA